jgi:hypothetical protein
MTQFTHSILAALSLSEFDESISMALRTIYNSQGAVCGMEPCDEPAPRALTPLEIVGLFTQDELLAIEQSTSLSIVAFRTQFFAAIVPIALDDQRFTGAISLLVTAEILTTERATSVLAGLAAQ